MSQLQHQLSQDSKIALQTSTKSDKQILVQKLSQKQSLDGAGHPYMLEGQANGKQNPHNRSMEEFARHTNTKLTGNKNRSISQASNQQSADLLIKNSRFNTHQTIEH